MKITDVRQEYFRWEKSRPITNGMHTYTHCGLAVITVETDQEITGYGLSGPVLGINPFMMVDELKDRLIGQDPMRTEWLWDRLYVPKLTGRKGISTRTISGIDMALWDIKAKSLGLPLYRLLGEYRRSVPVYIGGGYYEPGKGIADLQREMEGYMEQGVSGVSLAIRAFAPPVAIALVGGIFGLLLTSQGFGAAFPYSLLCLGMRANNPQMALPLPSFLAGCGFYLLLFSLLAVRRLSRRDAATG